MISRDFQKPGRSVALSDRAMAATSHPLATLAAVDVLREGGHAVEAAIAAVALQSVIDPLMTGIGGDCFAIVANEGGTPVATNGSGPAPRAAHLPYFIEHGLTAIADDSAHAVTVPGAVDAWCRLVAAHGRLGLERVLRPAIEAAEAGFCITPRVAFDWAMSAGRVARHAPARAHFLARGRAPEVGERFAQPALAATLRRIAREGRTAFYEGAVAEDIVATLRAEGGLHDLADFTGYHAFETQAIGAAYKGHELLECPPNGQGLAALLITRILDGFDFAALGEADRIHVLAEATKRGYAMRDAVIGDPRHGEIDVAALLDERFVAKIREGLAMDRAGPAAPWLGPTHRDTVTVSVVDAERNAVSLINSIFFPFGSGLFAAKSGVLLQNRGAGFSVVEGHPNAVAGGNLPFHTIIPGLLMKGGPAAMPFGVMGGQYQATGHAHLLSQMLDLGLDPQLANEAPRSFHHEGVLTLETTIGADVRADLEARDHVVEWADEPLGGCQSIYIDRERGVLVGSSDHRKDGMALGI